jgi:hypothetical protein
MPNARHFGTNVVWQADGACLTFACNPTSIMRQLPTVVGSTLGAACFTNLCLCVCSARCRRLLELPYATTSDVEQLDAVVAASHRPYFGLAMPVFC